MLVEPGGILGEPEKNVGRTWGNPGRT